MKVGEMIEFMGELRGLTRAEARKRGDAWLDRLGLGAVDEEQGAGPVEGHAAEGAVRDRADPRAGARDPRRAVERPRSDQRRGAARRRRRDPRAGRTVLFSTHQMEQAEKIVDAVCIIARGKKVLDGKLRDIKRSWRPQRLDRARLTPTMLRETGADAIARRHARSSPSSARRTPGDDRRLRGRARRRS